MQLIAQYMIHYITRIYIDDGQALKLRIGALSRSSGRVVIIASHFTNAIDWHGNWSSEHRFNSVQAPW